jgi:UDP-glucose 4-epimerase
MSFFFFSIHLGENPNGVPNNLMPYIQQVVVGRREKLTVFGNDFPTKDGTGVRDFIHVSDLGDGHLASLKYIQNSQNPKNGYGKCSIFNLGSGHGYSVMELIEGMKKASGRPLPYEFGPRRPGDIAECYADPTLAKVELGWEARRGLDEICRGKKLVF